MRSDRMKEIFERNSVDKVFYRNSKEKRRIKYEKL